LRKPKAGKSAKITEPNVYDGRRDKNASKIFFRFGKYTAMMHNALSVYRPTMKNFTRPNLSQYLEKKYEVIEEEKYILDIYKDCLKKVYSLPQTKKNFGLVHFDLHSFNFHVYKNDIIFFDFTDTRYSFFMWDVAKVFFSSVPFDLHSKKNLLLFRKKYESFIKGYKTKRALTLKDIDMIKLFLKMTELRMYFIVSGDFRKKFDKHNLWGQGFLKNRKEYIENNYTVFDAMEKYLGAGKSAV
jgi:Ser/Thr protein kinase RdoA (MazF antagonist)